MEELESKISNDGDSTYAKESLGTRVTETKLLGLYWDKKEDTLAVNFATVSKQEETTKRGVLSTIASVYDPTGLASPIMLVAKVIFRDICDQKLPWDKELPPESMRRWKTCLEKLLAKIKVPRAKALMGENISAIQLHGFADASAVGCCAVIFVLIQQGDKISQGILVAKSRLAKRNLTIPRLALVSCHMVSNLLDNTGKTLSRYPVVSKYAWTDSTVCLHWIAGSGSYKQFVSNRVKKINEKEAIWRYVPTGENPADIGSRGSRDLQDNSTWFTGPRWLTNQNEWPKEITTSSADVPQSENKVIKKILQATVQRDPDSIDELVERMSIGKTLRLLAWVRRFADKCRKRETLKVPLTAEETGNPLKFLIKRAQEGAENNPDCAKLNLQRNDLGIIECRGRIQGEYPIYLPTTHAITQDRTAGAFENFVRRCRVDHC